MSVSEVAESIDAFICQVLRNPKENYELVEYAAMLAKARMGMSAEQLREWESLTDGSFQGND